MQVTDTVLVFDKGVKSTLERQMLDLFHSRKISQRWNVEILAL